MQQSGARIWITGAAGFTGRGLVRAAVDAGHEVVASDLEIGAGPPIAADTVEWVRADVRDPDSLRQAVEPKRIDALIHAAAVTTGPDRDLIETNIVGTLNTLERAAESSIPKVVFVSSGAVYGVTEPDDAVDETSPLAGDSGYAWSKIAGELVCRRGTKRSGTAVLCCRLGALYGPDERATTHRAPVSTPSRLALSSRKRSPVGVSGLSYRRPYTHVDDAARAIVALSAQPDLEESVFNIEGGERLSLEELLEAASRAWPDFRWEHAREARGADVALRPENERARLDGRRLERAVGSMSWRSMEDGLRSYLR